MKANFTVNLTDKQSLNIEIVTKQIETHASFSEHPYTWLRFCERVQLFVNLAAKFAAQEIAHGQGKTIQESEQAFDAEYDAWRQEVEGLQ